MSQETAIAPVSDTSPAVIIDLLLSRKQISPAEVDGIIADQVKSNVSIEQALVASKKVGEEQIAMAYAEFSGLPLLPAISPSGINAEEVKQVLPEKFARDNRVLPLMFGDGVLQVGVIDPTEVITMQEIQLYTDARVDVFVATLSTVTQGLDKIYGADDAAKQMVEDTGEDKIDLGKEAEEDVLDLDRPVPETKETQVVRLVNRILQWALNEKASDIHLEPYPEECKVRYRVDGVLQEIAPPPRAMFVPLISRLKILAKMDIAEKRIPQDGAFSMKVNENKIDMRVSSVPTIYGEKIVMRILNKGATPLDLVKLGFNKKQREDYVAAANSPHGLLFVTGPTGSGKSTTLYATLDLLRSPRKNILTVEDPVEYKFVGINQVQVKAGVGLTFASTLRAFLRQDPDVIMVGEVRDQETAQICLRAALTGHFVLSTLHTNDSLSAVTRLADMGVEVFLLASTLRVVEAQRLLRRLCSKCKEPYDVDAASVAKFKIPSGTTIYRAKGCPECRGVGYRGRVGIYEVVKITPKLRDLIQTGTPLPKLREQASADGMGLLKDAGIEKVIEGQTSLEEVLTVTVEDEH